MDYPRINKLLDKYFAGETSLEEEKTLGRYFHSSQVADEHRQFSPLFRFFAAERDQQLNAAFARQLIDRVEAEIPGRKPAGRVRRLKIAPTLARVAAVLILALSVWWMTDRLTPAAAPGAIDWAAYEPESPEEAFRIFSGAVLKVSAELDQGAAQAAANLGKMKEVTRFFK